MSINYDDQRLISGGYWDDDDNYPIEDWQYEVANGNTRIGYWDWVKNQRSIDRMVNKNVN